MDGLRTQYFLMYAGIGCLGPFLPIYLSRQQGLTDAEVGLVLGVGGFAILLTPILMTRFADLGIQTRALLAGAFAGGSLALVGLSMTTGFVAATAFYLLYSLAEKPVGSLQDALFFRAQRLASEGVVTKPFYRVRVWGTVGFIIPSLLLYDLVERTGSTRIILGLAIGFGVLAVLNTRRLPAAESQIPEHHLSDGSPPGRTAAGEQKVRRRVTGAALRQLATGDVRTFVVGMFLVSMASAAWFAFYPLYLTGVVGIDERSVGLIFNVGVVLEIGWMLGFGRILRRRGLRGLMMAGAGAETLRLLLLAAWPSVAIAVGTQVLHGLVVIITSVAPQIFLDERADERYRSSIQGAYAMVVIGGGRMTGSVIAGQLASAGLRVLFAVAAASSVLAIVSFSRLRTADGTGVGT